MQDNGVIFNIILGSACNWHCPYCIQGNGAHCNKNYDAREFAKNLKLFIKNKGIKNIRRFSYWGGEPMLYLSKMETLLEEFKDMPTVKPHRTITNGSLVDDRFVELANNHHMLTNLSYHEGQLSYKQWKKCLLIKNLNITSLVHHKRLDWNEFYNKWEWINEEFGRCVNWFVYPMLSVDGVGSEFSLTCEDVDIYMENLYSYLDRINNVFFRKAISVMFFAFKMGDINKEYTNFCFNEDNYSIDLGGNRYLCHHNFTKEAYVSNIFENSIPILPESINKVINRSISHECQSCNVFKYCRGGCYRYVGQRVYCYYRRRMFEFLLYTKKNYSEYFLTEYLKNID